MKLLWDEENKMEIQNIMEKLTFSFIVSKQKYFCLRANDKLIFSHPKPNLATKEFVGPRLIFKKFLM